MTKCKTSKPQKGVKRQLNGTRVNKFDEDDFFDDCSVCQFTKKIQQEGRSPTMGEMKMAFRKAKEKGAVVVGALKEHGDAKNVR